VVRCTCRISHEAPQQRAKRSIFRPFRWPQRRLRCHAAGAKVVPIGRVARRNPSDFGLASGANLKVNRQAQGLQHSALARLPGCCTVKPARLYRACIVVASGSIQCIQIQMLRAFLLKRDNLKRQASQPSQISPSNYHLSSGAARPQRAGLPVIRGTSAAFRLPLSEKQHLSREAHAFPGLYQLGTDTIGGSNPLLALHRQRTSSKIAVVGQLALPALCQCTTTPQNWMSGARQQGCSLLSDSCVLCI
jgi:hypothetical protein